MEKKHQRTSKDSKELQSIIVKIDKRKYRLFRIKCAEHEPRKTMASVIRESVDEFISNK